MPDSRDLLQKFVSEEICSKIAGTKFWYSWPKGDEKERFSIAQYTRQVKKWR